jgi:hypothetical protein
MDVARPALIISFFLMALTLWYTGQWAGKDPRKMDLPLENAVAAVADPEAGIARN